MLLAMRPRIGSSGCRSGGGKLAFRRGGRYQRGRNRSSTRNRARIDGTRRCDVSTAARWHDLSTFAFITCRGRRCPSKKRTLFGWLLGQYGRTWLSGKTKHAAIHQFRQILEAASELLFGFIILPGFFYR